MILLNCPPNLGLVVDLGLKSETVCFETQSVGRLRNKGSCSGLSASHCFCFSCQSRASVSSAGRSHSVLSRVQVADRVLVKAPALWLLQGVALRPIAPLDSSF